MTAQLPSWPTTPPSYGSVVPLYRVELYIEPCNTSSIHVAEAFGYQREGLLRSSGR